MYRLLIIIIYILNNYPGYCQLTRIPESSSYIGMGAYTSSHVDIFSGIKNQAAIMEMNSSSAGIIATRHFLLKELSEYQLLYELNTIGGKFLIAGEYGGENIYNETLLGIATARQLGERIRIGLQFNYYTINQQGYGKHSAPGIELGTIIKLSEKCRMGIHAKNPVAGRFGRKEKPPSVYSSGLGYEISEKLSMVFEMIKAEGQEAVIVAGLIYLFVPIIRFKMGISTPIHSPWISIEYMLKRYILAMGATYHPQLGFSPSLSFARNLNSKKRRIEKQIGDE